MERYFKISESELRTLLHDSFELASYYIAFQNPIEQMVDQEIKYYKKIEKRD